MTVEERGQERKLEIMRSFVFSVGSFIVPKSLMVRFEVKKQDLTERIKLKLEQILEVIKKHSRHQDLLVEILKQNNEGSTQTSLPTQADGYNRLAHEKVTENHHTDS